jgi:lysophospholipase L1-like esterase
VARRRRLLFAAWVPLASLLLLEAVLQLAAAVNARLHPERVPLAEGVRADALHVVALGDSWVAGAEGSEGQGWLDHLGRELPRRLGADVQVWNLGRTGANSAHVALEAMDRLPALDPDLVIVLVGQNNSSNFYRVAEVEERLGREPKKEPWYEGSKVLKLARIVGANARGGSGYREGSGPRAEGGGAAEQERPAPEPETDESGQPIRKYPELLRSSAARSWLDRRAEEVGSAPKSGDPAVGAAWSLLRALARRDEPGAAAAEAALRGVLGWTAPDGSVGGLARASAPSVVDDREALARFALLRAAREMHRWTSVRFHGGALRERAAAPGEADPLVLLGAAEAQLLAGDWRSARDLLLRAHALVPGLPEIVDLAARFPDAARNPALYEALEFPPPIALPAWEEARMREANGDPEGAEEARGRWLAEHPEDRTLRLHTAADLALAGRHAEADALVEAAIPLIRDPTSNLPRAPDPVDAPALRFQIARQAESGDPAAIRRAVAQALVRASALGPEDERLLQTASRLLAAVAACDELPNVADRWFLARGDGPAYVALLAPCMDPGSAAARLDPLRRAWGPSGSVESWTALVRSGHKPFDLLYRDLDLVAAECRRLGARLLVLDYPNPGEDHTALRDVLADWAAPRGVPFLDLWEQFRQRFPDDGDWLARLGPNGHCNDEGYRLMADGVLSEIEQRRLLLAHKDVPP